MKGKAPSALGFVLASLAAAWTGAQAPPAPDTAPLPDVSALFTEVLANQEKVDEAREAYTYTMTVTDLKTDAKGHVTEGRVHTYEVFSVAGKRFRKLVAKDGQPLSPDEARKEEQRVAKAVREHKERQSAQAAAKQRKPAEKGDGDDDEVTASDLLRLCRFVNPRREEFRGQLTLAYDFEPRPDAKPRGRAESWIRKMGGRVWIDEHARRLLRLDAQVNESLKVGGGVVISVRPGSSLVFEQALVNDEVWLPTYAKIDISARFLLLKGVKQQQTVRFSDYRKFAVDTSEEIKVPRP
jgi:hypothetical protein